MRFLVLSLLSTLTLVESLSALGMSEYLVEPKKNKEENSAEKIKKNSPRLLILSNFPYETKVINKGWRFVRLPS